jgi:hypothetical protein
MTLTISLPMVLYASGPRSQLAYNPSSNMLAAAHHGKQNFDQVQCCISNTCFNQISTLYMMLCQAKNGHIVCLRCPKGLQLHCKQTALAEKRCTMMSHLQD